MKKAIIALSLGLGAIVASDARADGRYWTMPYSGGANDTIFYLAQPSWGMRVITTSVTAIQGETNTVTGVSGSSRSGIGVSGHSDSSVGVYGSSSTGQGVYAHSDSNSAVLANSNNRNGVDGHSNFAAGVWGESIYSHGVRGHSLNGDGVVGTTALDWQSGVRGDAADLTSTGIGVTGIGGPDGYGVYGVCHDCNNGFAGVFEGPVVTGYLHAELFEEGYTNPVCAQMQNGSAWLGHCGSSRRYKKDIQDFPLGLAAVESLRPVEFTLRSSGEHDFGFVAEEVAEVNPILVTYNSRGQPESVRYQQMVALLTNAVVELKHETQAEIRALRHTVDEQKAQAATQAKQLTEQKAQIAELSAKLAEQQRTQQEALARQQKMLEALVAKAGVGR